MAEKQNANPSDTAISTALDAETVRARMARSAFNIAEALSAEKAPRGGGKLSRSETVTVRLDPKLRYLAELAARLHRRTLSSYIEWAIVGSLENNVIRSDPSDPSGGPSIKDEAEYLWDVDDADRFAKLALRHPHLLTHEEQVRWKLIRENGYLWKGTYSGRQKEWTWSVDEDSFIFQRLREHWIAFCNVADSGTGHDSLPKWAKTDPKPPSPYGGPSSAGRPAPAPKLSSGFDDMDDDIPF